MSAVSSEPRRKDEVRFLRKKPGDLRPGSLQGRVLQLLQNVGPLTDEQMQKQLRINPNSQRPARIALVEAGLVSDSGRRRETQSGKPAVLWQCTEPGRDQGQQDLGI